MGGSLDVSRLVLVQKDAGVHSRGNDDPTTLHTASFKFQRLLDVVPLLIYSGADVNFRDNEARDLCIRHHTVDTCPRELKKNRKCVR